MTTAILRKTFNEVITERYRDGGVTDVSVGDHGGNSGSSVGVNVGVNVGDVPEIKLTDRQRIIISIIQLNPCVTVKQMTETISVSQRTIERDLAVMQKAKIIRHEGSDKAGIWVVLEKANINVMK